MFSVGIDLGGTNIAGAIVDKDGRIVRKKSIPTYRERDYSEIIKDIGKLCLMLIEEENIALNDIHSIGLGSPGTVNNTTGIIEYANNLKFNQVSSGGRIKKIY